MENIGIKDSCVCECGYSILLGIFISDINQNISLILQGVFESTITINTLTNSNTQKMVVLTKDQFKCDACGEVYKKVWSDNEANHEADMIWSKEERILPQSVVCDDCFQRLFNKLNSFLTPKK